MQEKTLSELRNLHSDYHKELHGKRPVYDLSHTKEELIDKINALDAYYFMLESTPQGRALLRENGWVVNV